MGGARLAAAGALAATVAVVIVARSGAVPTAACGLPESAPVWIDYGEGSLTADVRSVLGRPGIVVATSGANVPGAFRAAGAATVYFQRRLPAVVGAPADPADPASIPAAADALLARAQAQTACATPWIVLNELLGSASAAPWSPTTTTYRANVLALEQRLAAGGAVPVLLVHGDPSVAGAAAAWWRQIAAAGLIAYEAYYNAPRITAMGALAGNRRLRLGMRGSLRLFEQIGIPDERLGLVLGFHSAGPAGSGGRQGLQPREEWLRFVKWNALAARQVADDLHLATVISWGWGTFGPASADADKAAAACVYLWARDQGLCDGPAAGGPAFDMSLTEGQIVLGPGQLCVFAGGPILTKQVDALTRFTKSRQVALDALFARSVLAHVKLDERKVIARERQVIATRFGGRRAAYTRALAARGANVAVARAIIRDDLRRRAFAAQLRRRGSQETALEALADRASAVLAGATCLRDELPGWGWFPQSDARDLVSPPLARKLPFLLGDRTAPAAPAGVVAAPATPPATGVVLTWRPGGEDDLAGYDVYRATAPGGPWKRQSAVLLARPYFQDPAPPAGAVYVVRAVDTSGNRSAESALMAAASSPVTSPRDPRRAGRT